MAITKDVFFRYIDEHREDLVKFVCEGLAIPSINHVSNPDFGEELEFQKWLHKKFEEIGLESDIWAVDEQQLRPNVVGTLRGTGGGENLILNGHCDVMPILQPQNWKTDPFKPEVIDGNIYARGASDMKGGLLTAAWVVMMMKKLGYQPKGNVYIESAVGEENNAGATIGTSAICERGYQASFAIVPEGTSMEIQPAACGCFEFDIKIWGKEAHSSARNVLLFPQHLGIDTGSKVGVDALSKAIKVINLMYQLEQEWNVEGKHWIIGRGGTTVPNKPGMGGVSVNPSIIKGGTICGAVMGEVTIRYIIYHPSTFPRDEIIKEIESKVYHLCQTDEWLKDHPVEFDWSTPEWRPSEVPSDHPGLAMMEKIIAEVTGSPAVYSGNKAVIDTTYLCEHGTPAIVCGPGCFAYGVHGDNEYIPVDELVTAGKVFSAAIMDWCN